MLFMYLGSNLDAHIKKMPWIQSHIYQKNDIFTLSSYASPSLPYKDSTTPSSSSSSKITPAILFIIVIVAVIFFISGLLHLLVRFLSKHRSSSSNSHSSRYPEMSSSNSTFQRQLQQLFHLHDSGLDQSFIDALPVFHYKELMMDGLKEPFDCPVCLCEFSQEDKLRLLPLCSHAFHINCIDTWLLSNSTCPLCRATLYNPGLPIENPVFDFEDSREVCFSGRLGDRVLSIESKPGEREIMNGKRVFSVRLGNYRNINNEVTTLQREETEASNSNLDARRCYSMGSFQYVVANSDLQVTLCQNKATPNGDGNNMRIENRGGGQIGNLPIDGDCEGKKIKIGSKNESFSVSKVWLWSKKGKFDTSSSNPPMGVDLNLPWANNINII